MIAKELGIIHHFYIAHLLISQFLFVYFWPRNGQEGTSFFLKNPVNWTGFRSIWLRAEIILRVH